jgi:hypothetical protein
MTRLFEPQRAVVLFGNPACDRKPEPSPARTRPVRQAHEALEDAIAFRERDARSGVLNAYHRRAIGSRT